MDVPTICTPEPAFTQADASVDPYNLLLLITLFHIMRQIQYLIHATQVIGRSKNPAFKLLHRQVLGLIGPYTRGTPN